MLLARLCIVIYYLVTVFFTSASCYILVIYEPHSVLHLTVGIFLLITFRFTSQFPHSQSKPLLLPISFIHITELYQVFSPNSTIAGKLSDDRTVFNSLNAELNPICYLLALLAHHFLYVSSVRVKLLTLRLLMSYIWSTYS